MATSSSLCHASGSHVSSLGCVSSRGAGTPGVVRTAPAMFPISAVPVERNMPSLLLLCSCGPCARGQAAVIGFAFHLVLVDLAVVGDDHRRAVVRDRDDERDLVAFEGD